MVPERTEKRSALLINTMMTFDFKIHPVKIDICTRIRVLLYAVHS
jgi:hypothetical protein